uniref:Minor capsid protein P11 C-terminal conserved region domain-containing protein n=1 Tax=viral metagenome TaxID=1070528 RepID=A0A6C0EMV7_9ZZZZ
MNLKKTITNLANNHTVLFTIVAAVALMYVMKNYSNGKGLGGTAGFSSQSGSGPLSGAFSEEGSDYVLNARNPPQPGGSLGSPTGTCGQGTNYKASAGLGLNETSASVSGIATSSFGMPPSCTKQSVVDPRQLLPRDSNNSFSQMNPGGAGDIQNVSLLKAGYHIGINTVGQSLRNANLQLRSEPANPQVNIGPWNQTTIGPDLARRALEVGCHGGQ